MDPNTYAILCLLVGMATVLGLIIFLKANAFIALITAAMVVSLMASGDIQDKFSRVASAFGDSAKGIGIVIALAAIIGKCMLDSGAADRVVRFFMNLLGEKRAPLALMGSGFVLAVPVFFDTVFYLLVPLARSLFKRTNRNYLLYVMAIGTGGAITHTLVPPTPGPLLVADQLNVDKGLMILIGGLVAFPAAIAGLLFSSLMNKLMPLPMRPVGNEPEPESLPDDKLPPLWLALLPVILPVLLISSNTILTTVADGERAAQLQTEDITDWDAFRARVRTENATEGTPGNVIVNSIRKEGAVDAEAREAAATMLTQDAPLNDEQKSEMTASLNKYVLLNKQLYSGGTKDAFLGVKMNEAAESLLPKNTLRMKPVIAERRNRSLLESTYTGLVQEHKWDSSARKAANWSSLIGNPSFALLLSAVVSMWTLLGSRGLTRTQLASSVETALMSGGLIILITAAGGAFGAMLGAAKVGDAIQAMFPTSGGGESAKLMILLLGFGIAAVLKIAQGSSTVAMITGSAMVASLASPETLGCHPVYLATSIGAGSLIGSWMNDSGFWVFAKMSGLTEVEALKTWTMLLMVLGIVSFAVSLLLATFMPLV